MFLQDSFGDVLLGSVAVVGLLEFFTKRSGVNSNQHGANGYNF